MDREIVLPLAARRVAQARRYVARRRQRILMLEVAGCSTRNAQQTLEVLLRPLGILERPKRELQQKFSLRGALVRAATPLRLHRQAATLG
jgi:hypothetical protein